MVNTPPTPENQDSPADKLNAWIQSTKINYDRVAAFDANEATLTNEILILNSRDRILANFRTNLPEGYAGTCRDITLWVQAALEKEDFVGDIRICSF